jgi:hypothetical protein
MQSSDGAAGSNLPVGSSCCWQTSLMNVSEQTSAESSALGSNLINNHFVLIATHVVASLFLLTLDNPFFTLPPVERSTL